MISRTTCFIEGIQDFKFEVNPVFHFSCVHNACDLLMQFYGVENREFYLDCTLDLKIIPQAHEPAYQVLYRHDPFVDSNFYHFLHLSNYSENEIWEMNQASVANNIPVILGVDQYYLPYSKDYRKIHGAHAVILCGFHEGKECFLIDCIGQSDYRGFVSIEQLHKARISQNSWNGTVNSGGSIQYASITINDDEFHDKPRRLLEKTLSLSYGRFYGPADKADASFYGIEAMQFMLKCLYHQLEADMSAYQQAFMDFYTAILYHIKKKELFLHYLKSYLKISPSDHRNDLFQKMNSVYKKWHILMKLCLKIAYKSLLIDQYLQEFRILSRQCLESEKSFYHDFRKYMTLRN